MPEFTFDESDQALFGVPFATRAEIAMRRRANARRKVCVHCRKAIRNEPYDGKDIWIDVATEGDVCGAYGTFGNEPHIPE